MLVKQSDSQLIQAVLLLCLGGESTTRRPPHTHPLKDCRLVRADLGVTLNRQDRLTAG